MIGCSSPARPHAVERTQVDLRGFARCCELDADSCRVVVSVQDQASRVPAQLQRDRYWTAHVFEELESRAERRNVDDATATPRIGFGVVESVEAEPIGGLSWYCPS